MIIYIEKLPWRPPGPPADRGARGTISYPGSVGTRLHILYEANIKIVNIRKPKNNLSPAERKALKDLKNNTEINIRKADKGTSSVFMSLTDKINEGQIQLDNVEHYRPLAEPMVEETSRKVQKLITALHNEHHIDEMTKKWLCQTPNPPRIPVFYTLTKIHKPTPVGRPIISGVSGPTEKLSAFVEKLLQPIAQQQKSYLKDTTDFINFIERTKVPENVILVSMDVTSLFTNIPQEEAVQTICQAYDTFYRDTPPIPTRFLAQTLRFRYYRKTRSNSVVRITYKHTVAFGCRICQYFYGQSRNRNP